MNKKVYYNSKYILLTKDNIQPAGNQLIVDTSKSSKILLNEGINKFIQQNDGPDLILKCDNVESLFDELKTQFKYIEAAGGLIEQNNPPGGRTGKYLFIYRLDKWDLPKGKIDKGESPQQAAVREVQEETGLRNVILGAHIIDTYHTYVLKDKRILKKTYWYEMKTTDMQLIPQQEEDIEQAEWVVLRNFLSSKPVIYGNILIVLDAFV